MAELQSEGSRLPGAGVPLLSIVIVSYNTRDETIACLDSIVASDPRTAVEVILVDNASSDGTVDAVRGAHPEVTVLETGENAGFARGVNLGAAASAADYVMLLNPDTQMLPGSIDALVDFAIENPTYGVYGGRTLRPDGGLEPSSCWGAPSLWSLTCFALGLTTAFKRSSVFDPESLGNWQRETVREVPVITGCLLMMRRADWAELGGMDERFFLYGEDAEFSLRAHRHGHRPVVVPAAKIVHAVGGSTDGGSTTNGRKMSMVMAGKATLLRVAWGPGRASIGLFLLQLGALTRAGLERIVGRHGGTWQTVWRRRADWRDGYPAAKAALFGPVEPTGSATSAAEEVSA